MLGSRITSLGSHTDDNSPLTPYYSFLPSSHDSEEVDILYWDKKFDGAHFSHLATEEVVEFHSPLFLFTYSFVGKGTQTHDSILDFLACVS